MTKNYTKQRGYLQIDTPEGAKWMHFSMNALVNLKDINGLDIATWGKELDKADTLEQGVLICDLIYSGMLAFDQEEGNNADYNVFKVRNWALEAMDNDDQLATKIFEALRYSMGKAKEAKKH